MPHRFFARMGNLSSRKCLFPIARTRVESDPSHRHVADQRGRNEGGLAMRKLFMAAAALTIAVATTPNFVGQSEAASAKKTRTSMTAQDIGPGSQYCDLAKNQRNAPSWNEHYRCLKTTQRQAFAQGAAPTRTTA